jgi:hypothetical protein
MDTKELNSDLPPYQQRGQQSMRKIYWVHFSKNSEEYTTHDLVSLSLCKIKERQGKKDIYFENGSIFLGIHGEKN